ncbi:hypothetical protein [Acetobacter cibinongensis]|uniref:Uncharacterized protein n=1 Tax=Acetobacter cibinongensis TaxID=146475 RepID=A0A1Z5YVZ9_9PROT|nr:hypothetical protein [Acetobacter cibinongensis]OUJ03165.1 hypothetical protein HK14_03085 [Acetobacter cibinongensis]
MTNPGNWPDPELVKWEGQAKDALQKMETGDGYFSYGSVVWDALPDAHREVLKQLLYQGPVADGNIISKAARNDLFELGLAVRCCFLGECGYSAATYAAYAVAKQGKADPFPVRNGSPA